MAERQIFFSYCWKDRKIVDEIDDDFKSIGITLLRDVRDAPYMGNIKSYMKRIRKTDYVLLIISESFLKSKNCMYEILELMKDEGYTKRLLIITISNINLADLGSDLRFVSYWEAQIKRLKKKLTTIKDQTAISKAHADLQTLKQIKNSISPFIDQIASLNTATFENLKDSNYRPILDSVGYEDIDLAQEVLRIKSIDDAEEKDIELDILVARYGENWKTVYMKATIAW